MGQYALSATPSNVQILLGKSCLAVFLFLRIDLWISWMASETETSSTMVSSQLIIFASVHHSRTVRHPLLPAATISSFVSRVPFFSLSTQQYMSLRETEARAFITCLFNIDIDKWASFSSSWQSGLDSFAQNMPQIQLRRQDFLAGYCSAVPRKDQNENCHIAWRTEADKHLWCSGALGSISVLLPAENSGTWGFSASSALNIFSPSFQLFSCWHLPKLFVPCDGNVVVGHLIFILAGRDTVLNCPMWSFSTQEVREKFPSECCSIWTHRKRSRTFALSFYFSFFEVVGKHDTLWMRTLANTKTYSCSCTKTRRTAFSLSISMQLHSPQSLCDNHAGITTDCEPEGYVTT